MLKSRTAVMRFQILGGGILLAVLLFWVFSLKTPAPAPPVPAPVPETGIHEKTIASGLKIDDWIGDRKLFSMQIEKLRVVKKKLGFFRMGFFKVARVEGVRLDWYGGALPGKSDSSGQTRETALASGHLSGQLDKLKTYLPGNIRAVELAEVKMNFFRGGERFAMIASDIAAPDRQGRGLVLEGNVRVYGKGGKKLESEKMTWIAGTGELVSMAPFVFTDGGRRMEGKGFKTDFQLTEIIEQERKTQ